MKRVVVVSSSSSSSSSTRVVPLLSLLSSLVGSNQQHGAHTSAAAPLSKGPSGTTGRRLLVRMMSPRGATHRHRAMSTTTSRPRSWTFPVLAESSQHLQGLPVLSPTFLLERALRHGHRPFVREERPATGGGVHNNGVVRLYSYHDVLMMTSLLKQRLMVKVAELSATTTTSSHNHRPRFVAHSSLPGADYVATQWACYASSFVSVPLATSHTVLELAHVLRDTDPVAIVVVCGGSGSGCDGGQNGSAATAAPNRSQVLEAAASLGMANRVMEVETMTTIGDGGGEELDVDYLLHRPEVANDASAIASSHPALLVYTSGTTGPPKGVLSTHNNLFYQITDLVGAWEWQNTDRALHLLPLHHVHGIVNVLGCASYVGAEVHFSAPFDAVKLWNDWAGLGASTPGDLPPNVLMAVPTIYAKLLEAARLGGDADSGDHDGQDGVGVGIVSPETVQAAVTRTLAPMRLQVSGSAALPVSVMEEWRVLTGHTLLERYGMTEFAMALSNPYRHQQEQHQQQHQQLQQDATGAVAPTPHHRHPQRIPGHVGLPLPTVQVRIVDETDPSRVLVQADGNDDVVVLLSKTTAAVAEAAAGAGTGEGAASAPLGGALQVRGPTVFGGYWNRPAATADAFTDDGWFDTGDVAEYDPNLDSFRILGRASVDILKVGGHKVSALEVERHVLDHPDLNEAYCVGVDDAIWGQRVAVVARQDPIHARRVHPVTLKEVQDWCAPRLARYKIPTRLLLLEDIPKNAMGKVNKKELARLFGKDG